MSETLTERRAKLLHMLSNDIGVILALAATIESEAIEGTQLKRDLMDIRLRAEEAAIRFRSLRDIL